MMISETSSTLIWAHIGDLHITAEDETNYRDFQSIIDSMNTHLAGRIDFCVLPGDNADDGSADQYDLIRRALEHLKIPVHVIPGDHDRKLGHLDALYRRLGVASAHAYISLASLNRGVVSWRFKPIRSLWPFVMITSPADHRLVTDIARPGHVVATPSYRPPQRIADGSDADALSAWPERHLLGTRLGPNRNGRQW